MTRLCWIFPDYKSGWWWENTGSGGSVDWDWMNVGWWDFEYYANQGLCPFNGKVWTDWHGVTMQYDQAGEELVYKVDGENYMKYEMDSGVVQDGTEDQDWGWFWWNTGVGQGVWEEWEDAGANPYALKTNSYSGWSSEFLYDNTWRPLPGGHGDDWVFFDNSGGLGGGGIYYFRLDSGMDFSLDYTSGAGGAPTYEGAQGFTGATSDWQYMGDSMFVFQTSASWEIYDGSYGVDAGWFTYQANSWTDPGFGNWDFDSTLGEFNLAFLSGVHSTGYDHSVYSSNADELIENCIYMLGFDNGGSGAWDYDVKPFGEIVDVVGAISQSQGNQYFSTVMFHGRGWTHAGGALYLGTMWLDEPTDVTFFVQDFEELAGYLMGSGAELQIMSSDIASSTTGTDILSAIQDALTGNGPWGSNVTLWASDDVTGNWLGVEDAEPNWFLEWSDAGGGVLSLSKLLYGADYTGAVDTGLVGDGETA